MGGGHRWNTDQQRPSPRNRHLCSLPLRSVGYGGGDKAVAGQ